VHYEPEGVPDRLQDNPVALNAEPEPRALFYAKQVSDRLRYCYAPPTVDLNLKGGAIALS
jgi:hypothetical protein